MTHKPGSDASHAPLPQDIADHLLDLLSSDDDFRSAFQANPAAALGSLGYTPAQALGMQPPDSGQPFYCMTSNTLASKEEIAKARKELLTHLMSSGNHHVVFCMEAGKVDSSIR